MSVYAEDIATAVELLGEFGAVATVRPLASGAAVDGKAWRVAAPDTIPSFEADCVIIPKGGVGATTLVPYEALGFLLPKDNANVITNECVITDAGGKAWQVNTADVLSPDATSVILYICELVKWPQT